MPFGVLGLVCCVLLALAAVSSEAFAASWAPGVEAKLPGSTFSSWAAFLDSVSCASAGDCSAVGGLSGGVLLSESGGVWGVGVDATLPATPGSLQGGGPSSVSCGSPGNCSAVGGYSDQTGPYVLAGHGLLVGETAGRWAAGVNPDPDVGLNSVSCASAGNCTAVGGGFLLSETAGRWAAGMQPTLPANAGPSPSVQLSSVSCASAGDCSAVGSYIDTSGHQQWLLLSESGGRWAAGVEAALPANAGADPFPVADGPQIGSVSCASAGNCSAVGSYIDSAGSEQGLLLSESGGRWGAGVDAVMPANAGADPFPVGDGPQIGAVSCASAGNCSAVGSYFDSAGNEQGLLLSETGGAWARGVEATLPANAASDPFGEGPEPLKEPIIGGPDVVSCASAGNCTIVGRYYDASAGQEPFLLSESGGTWERGVEAILPANARPSGSGGLNSVSCAPGGDCSAVGYYLDNSGDMFGLLVNTLAVPSRLRVSPGTFVLAGRRVNSRCVMQTAKNRTQPSCARLMKLNVRYQLNIPARVTITIKRALAGRLSKRQCVAPTRENRTHRHCTRLAPVDGTLTQSASQGANSLAFNGRIGGRRLAPGTYQLTATPSFGNPQRVTFQITG